MAKKSSLIDAHFFQKKINRHLYTMLSAYPNGIANIRLWRIEKSSDKKLPTGPKSDLISNIVELMNDEKAKCKQLNEKI